MAMAVSGCAWQAEQPPSVITRLLALRCSGRLRRTASRAETVASDDEAATAVGGVSAVRRTPSTGESPSALNTAGLLNLRAHSTALSPSSTRNDASAPF